MEPTFRILKLGEDEEEMDRLFWQSKPPSERIAAVEILRKHMALITHGSQPGLQRVFRIVQHA